MNSNNYKSLLDEIEEEHKQSTEKSLDKNSRVIIIDGLNTFIRAFSANPSINDDGVHVGGIIGFLKSIRYAISKLKPTRCIIVFDGKNGTKKRKKLYPEYKSQRKVRHRFNRNVDWSTSPVDEEYSMKMQLSRLIKYLDQLPISILSIDNVEADDVIAYISTTVLKNEKIIMSTDKDFLQLISDDIKIWSPTKKILYNKDKVFEEYGIPSKNLLTFKILDGDKSDNINGIRGAGIKTIVKNIPQISENKKFDIKDLISFIDKTNKKIKLFENIKNNYKLLKRNYLLMQLHNVDIGNHNKLKIQNVIHEKIPQLVKYKFSTMFIQDKLWSHIPNMEAWITEFIRLDRFRYSNG